MYLYVPCIIKFDEVIPILKSSFLDYRDMLLSGMLDHLVLQNLWNRNVQDKVLAAVIPLVELY